MGKWVMATQQQSVYLIGRVEVGDWFSHESLHTIPTIWRMVQPTLLRMHIFTNTNCLYFFENSIRSEHFWWYTLFNSIHATTGLIINVWSAGNNSHGEKMYANICTVKIFCKQKVEQQTADTHSDSHLALVRFLSRISVICNGQGSPLLLCLTDDYSNCLVHVYVSRWQLAWFFWGMSHVTENKVKWNWPQQIKNKKKFQAF